MSNTVAVYSQLQHIERSTGRNVYTQTAVPTLPPYSFCIKCFQFSTWTQYVYVCSPLICIRNYIPLSGHCIVLWLHTALIRLEACSSKINNLESAKLKFPRLFSRSPIYWCIIVALSYFSKPMIIAPFWQRKLTWICIMTCLKVWSVWGERSAASATTDL